MISTNSLSKEKKYKSGKYYGFRIRSTWHILLIFIIITLVVMVIPSVLNSAMLRSRILEECAAMTPEEIACLSYMFRAPYNSYGRLRAYVYAMGELPGRQWEKGGENE